MRLRPQMAACHLNNCWAALADEGNGRDTAQTNSRKTHVQKKSKVVLYQSSSIAEKQKIIIAFGSAMFV